MNIRDLKYLVALAQHRHFSKAADHCFVSQPALSMQIKKLEQTLGVALLERTPKGLLFTDIGEKIAQLAQEVLRQVSEISEVAQAACDPYSGEFKLGIFPTLAPYVLPKLMPHLTKWYPKLKLYLVEEKTGVLLEALQQGKLHAALLAEPIPQAETVQLVSHTVFEEAFLLAVQVRHPLAKRQSVTVADMESLSLMLLEEGHCLRQQALSVCTQMKASVAQNFQATSLETLRHMVAAGIGITLMPQLACYPTPGVVYLPFDAPQAPMRTIALCWRASTARTILLEDMVVRIRDIKWS